MNLSETCPCSGDALGAAVGWRSTHRHEVLVEVEDAEEEA